MVYGVITFLVVTNFWIINSTSHKIFNDLEQVPVNEVALVFGTSKYKTGGGNNLFFDHRISAAANLYKARKVEKIILSGTKDPKYYNEPKDMKAALMEQGVPEEVIILDNKGFRTFDSVLNNGKETYNGFTLITQRYHAYRALFISAHLGIESVCYEADFPSEDYSYVTIIREVFARPKAVLDLYILESF